MTDRATYVILGNGPAGVQAVEGIRSVDPDGSITLVAAEPEHAYSRPLITYRLAGKVDDDRMDYRGRDFYDRHGVGARLGVRVQRIALPERELICEDGPPIGFEKLLIATGGAPIRPDIPGLDETDDVFTLTTWADTRSIDGRIGGEQVHRAVVLGGGLIGLKSVEALAARGVPTTLVELADRILPATFDHEASRLAEAALAERGVEIRTSCTVAKVLHRRGRMAAVVLSDDSYVECDLLILAIGVRPDLSLLEGTGIRTDRGILVDDHMATSVEGIYAAGDVAESRDLLTGESRPAPILPVAARQGRMAGTNMAGGDAVYDGSLAKNAVDVLGLPTISVGQTTEAEGDEVLREIDDDGRSYRKLVIRDGRLIGAIFVGRIDRAGIFTGLIRTGLDIGEYKELLMDDQFGLLSLPAEYRAHMVSGLGIEV